MKKVIIWGLLTITLVVSLCSCGLTKNNVVDSDAKDAMNNVIGVEMSLSEALGRNQMEYAMRGKTYDINELDCSELVDTMSEYDAYLKYNNVYIWMCKEGYYEPVDSFDESTLTINDEDYEEMMSRFYNLSPEEQNTVLLNIFKDTGAVRHQKVAVEFGYVPTGEITDDGTVVTNYEATDIQDISLPVYAATPLDISFR